MFIGLAGRDTEPPMEAFVARHGLEHMVHAIDTDRTLWQRFGVEFQPAWVFINDDGAVDVHIGELYEPQLSERLQALIDA